MTAIGAIRRINMSAAHTRIAIAIAALACALGALPASAADFVMKFGTATINETQHQFIKFYKDEVEQASNGLIEVQIYPASQLGPIPPRSKASNSAISRAILDRSIFLSASIPVSACS